MKLVLDAFNFWFSCTQEGDTTTRALERTAEEFGVHERTARKWYDEMGWKKMGQKRMKQIQRELEKRDNRTFAQNQKKYLDILHRLLYDYVEDGLPAKIETVKDLEIVIKNSLFCFFIFWVGEDCYVFLVFRCFVVFLFFCLVFLFFC